ncbi:mechanosensitive ion channel family protein [Vibrio sp. 10N]|uniref:mechanosensitive ion channel family protein n=1 Tax=Vibrio sp. 10N TaxID=3058938 RepID=UPI002812D4C9|nr:hypothetical protein VB10N_42500 [Vibrio sp. 10N]
MKIWIKQAWVIMLGLIACFVNAQERFPLSPPDTSTPKLTYDSYIASVTEANRELGIVYNDLSNVSEDQRQKIHSSFERAALTFDLSQVAASSQNRVAIESVMLLKEVLDRVPTFDTNAIPNSADIERWTVPNTNISIVRQPSGHYQFSSDTVTHLHRYYGLVSHLPSNIDASPDYYKYYSLSAGRLIPPGWFAFVESMPAEMMIEIGDQAIWQWIALLLLSCVLVLYAYAIYHKVQHVLLKPVMMAFGLFVFDWTADYQFNLTGTLMTTLNMMVELLFWPLIAQAAYLLGASGCRWLMVGQRLADGLKKSLAQIMGTLAGSFCAVCVIGYGLHRLGVPVYGIITGLSLGGMAIALAIRPTMENLIGGVIMFMDKSLSVGDFCSVGSVSGVVEQIGVRSTRIRAKDRTLITISNGDVVKMQITNFSRRDRYPFLVKLGLRYETPMETMVAVTRDIREFLAQHPRVLASPLRVHFSSFSDYSLDIDVFAHIDTRDREDFLNTQQELLMEINRVIDEHGAEFAFPSTTTYLNPDSLTQAPTTLKLAGDGQD